jgi:hypothetical protein
MYQYIGLLFLCYFIKFISKKNILESKSVQYKINKITKNNFIFSISLLPYFNKNNIDYFEFYKMIDFVSNNKDNYENIYKNSKISIKIRQLAKTQEEQQVILENIIEYANKKDVFVWISCVLKDDLNIEYNTYLKFLNKNYKNVGLTLATYNSSINSKVDNILKLKGHIRLVKGYYYGDINDYKMITNLYYLNAKKLVESKNFHTLATHDFELLNKLKKEYNSDFNNIELAFFYIYFNNVIKNISHFENIKSFYIPYGSLFKYLIHNILYINLYQVYRSSRYNFFNI